jgi:hypothetical protein
MSTEGKGKCCQVVFAPGTALLDTSVALGDGVVFVGKAIDEWSVDSAKKLAKLEAEAKADALKNINTLRDLSTQAEATAINKQFEGAVQSRSLSKADTQALEKELAQARAAIAGIRTGLKSPAERERQQLQQSLKREIIRGRSLLSASLLQEAGAALEGPKEAVSKAIFRLMEARQRAEGKLSLRERQRWQVEEAIQFATAQLQVVEQMLQEMSSGQQAVFVERRKAIQSLLATIDPSEENGLEEAIEQAIEAQQNARVLSGAVTTALVEAWSTTNSQVNAQLGGLQVLRDMLTEVDRMNVANRRVVRDLTERVTDIYDEAQSLTGHPLRHAQQWLAALEERISPLKREVFTLVEMSRQRVIAETIAATLLKLDFGSLTRDQRLVRENGDVLRVVATPGGKKSAEGRDDRIVSFEISRSGDVAYDFVGYTGDSCIEEAEKIFAALRAKGLYVLDPKGAQRLQAAARERPLTLEMLNRPELQVHPVKNKMQAELAERLHVVLERMQYHKISQQVVGGCIEMEAFNGPVGYRVVLKPEGSMQVFKDEEMNELDVALDSDDPIVAEAIQVRGRQADKQDTLAPEKRRQTPAQRLRRNLQEQ